MSDDPRVLLLVAGYPGTGKSRLCAQLRDQLGALRVLAIDDLKEALYDEHGFGDAQAKAHLDAAAREVFLAQVRTAMHAGGLVAAEYPFSEKQRPQLQQACTDLGYRPLTVRLVADVEVLYERQRRRDLDPSRHVGHLLDAYRPGDTLEDRLSAPQLLTREVFWERYHRRGYGTFALGPVIELDTTHPELVDDAAVIRRIMRALAGEGS